MRPIMLLNVSSPNPPNTVSCGLDAQKQTETDAGEGEGRQLGRCTAELRLILNYDSLFAFMAKHLQLKRFSRTLSRHFHFPAFSFYLSTSLCLFVLPCACRPTKVHYAAQGHRRGLMQNIGQRHKLN